ncbi:putative bifunctional diguanylate cyclase/phosphodiesterase [Sulfurimonas sp.]
MNKGLRITIIGSVLIAIVVSIEYIYTTQTIKNLKSKIYIKTSKEMVYDFENLLNGKVEDVSIASVSSTNNLNSDKTALALEKYSLFHDISFVYRKKSSFAQEAPEKINTVISFYKDRAYFTIDAISPVYNNKGRFIGNMSTYANYNSFSLGLDSKNYDVVAIVDKNKTRYISNPFFHAHLVEALNLLSNIKLTNLDTCFVDEKSGLLLSTFYLKNVKPNTKIKIVLATKLKDLNMSVIDYEIKNNTLFAVLIFAFLMLLLYKVFITNYRRSVGDYYEEIEKHLKFKESEIGRQADVIQFIAHNDPLTGLNNKLSLVNKLEDVISNATINDYKVGIIFLDLDEFKKINDVYGHDIGDILLQKVAERLKECARKEDTIARISGDEFVIIENKMTDVSNINLIERITMSMKKPFFIKNKDIHISFSIGRSILDKDGKDADTLLKNAEAAMYISKNIGPNNYVSYDESMSKMSQKRIELDKNIRNALKNYELEPYYQPKINSNTGEIIGLEALIRWNDTKKGIIYPSEFIPFCEESDLIVDIDKYMLIHVMRQVLKWQKEGIKTGKVSVNISTKKLEKGNFVSELKQIILNEGFDTQYLELEILESQIMTDPQRSIRILREIKELGISISIDDFGTGYSSLSYLKELPIDSIKIDRSFIVDLSENKDSISIVRTIIALAKNLNLNIIAEGVETKEQLDFLKSEGCPYIQGYYFSKPLPMIECKDYLVSNKNKR